MRPAYEIQSDLAYSVGASPKLHGRASPAAVDIFSRRARVGAIPSVVELTQQQLAAYPILRTIGAANALILRWALEYGRSGVWNPSWNQFLGAFYRLFYADADTGPEAFRSYWHGDRAGLQAYERTAAAWLEWARNAAGAKAMRTGTR